VEKKKIKIIKWKVFFPIFVLAAAPFLFAQGSVSAPDEEKVEIVVQSGNNYNFTSVCFSPDGKNLASFSGDNTIRIWDSSTGKMIRKTTLNSNDRYDFSCFSSDGKILATGGYGIILWDAETGIAIRHIVRYNSDYLSGDGYLRNDYYNRENYSIQFSPEGKILASWGSNGSIKLWDTATGGKIWERSEKVVLSVHFSPDGKTLSAKSYNDIKLLDTKTGSLLYSPGVKMYGIVSPNGKIQASEANYYDSNNIILSDTAFGRKLRELIAHRGKINSICFSPDGKTLASGSADGTIKTWNSITGELLATLVGFKDGEWVVYTPDNFFICSDGGDKYITFKKGKSLYLVDEYGTQFKKQNIALVSEIPSEYSEKNNITDQPDIVKSDGDSSLIHVVKSLLGKSTCWAVLIGIKDYSFSNNGFKPLPYAINDAEAVKKYLVNTMKISQDHIIPLYNSRASRQNIEYYLGEKIPQLVGKDDRVIIYFSGHGSH